MADDTTDIDMTTEPVGQSAMDAPEREDGLGDAGKQALDRMKAERDAARREARANADAAKRLADIEDASKSELQRVQDKLAALERDRDAARAEGLRFKIAAKYGVGEEDAALFLTGGDEESLTRQAERLASREAQRQADEEAAEDERQKAGNFVPREGHGMSNHNDADSAALSVLGFG